MARPKICKRLSRKKGMVQHNIGRRAMTGRDRGRRRAGAVALAGCLLWLAAVGRLNAAPPPTVDYHFQIRPLLADRCFVCHGPDENKRKAKLRLDVADVAFARRAIVPGKPEESALIERITAEDPDQRMPPAKSNLRLSQGEI